MNVGTSSSATFTAMHGLMLKHGITLRTINMCGPGGGNPQVIATAADDGAARCFLAEFFGDLDY